MIGEIFEYAKKKYDSVPEYLWLKSPDSSILRHKDSRKWYAVFMKVKKSVFGFNTDEYVYVIDVKCGMIERDCLFAEKKAYPAYHMNKQKWISVLLDGTVETEIIYSLIDESYRLTEGKNNAEH